MRVRNDSPTPEIRRGAFSLTLAGASTTIKCFGVAQLGEGWRVFEFIDPRLVNLVLGVTIGMSLSLVWHWMSWTFR